MLVISDFDYHESKDDLHGILYDPATSRRVQNWIPFSPISEVKICVEQSIYNRCIIYPSIQTAFLCSLIRKNALDNKFPIHLRSRENIILQSFWQKIFTLTILKEMARLPSANTNTRGRIGLQAITKSFS